MRRFIALAAVVAVGIIGIGATTQPADASVILGCSQFQADPPEHLSGSYVSAEGHLVCDTTYTGRWVRADVWQKVGGVWTDMNDGSVYDISGTTGFISVKGDMYCGANISGTKDYKSRLVIGNASGEFYAEFSSVASLHRDCAHP